MARNLAEGGVLVIVVLLVMLGNLRAGLIVATAIPLSMLFAGDLMLAYGIAGSLMSLGGSLPLMFVGWEGVGLCSYLLIGFWFRKPAAAAAAKKAFVVNRIGDFMFLLGMFLLYWAVKSLDFNDIKNMANVTVLHDQVWGVQ